MKSYKEFEYLAERAFSPAGQTARKKMRQQADFNAARKAYDAAKAKEPKQIAPTKERKALPGGKKQSFGDYAKQKASSFARQKGGDLARRAADKGAAIVRTKKANQTDSTGFDRKRFNNPAKQKGYMASPDGVLSSRLPKSDSKKQKERILKDTGKGTVRDAVGKGTKSVSRGVGSVGRGIGAVGKAGLKGAGKVGKYLKNHIKTKEDPKIGFGDNVDIGGPRTFGGSAR